MGRTPQQQAADFVEANDRHPVVAGRVIEARPPRYENNVRVFETTGIRYQTDDGKWHRLGKVAVRLLPTGYPRWRHQINERKN